MPGLYKTAAGEAAVRARYAEFLARWPVENVHLRVPTGQGETFVVASGPPDAPPVLLLHGSASNAAMWMGDVAAWARGFRVYAVDMIGEPGFSAPSRPTLASGAYAPWLDEVTAGLGLERAAVVGMSLGGWLALEFATRHPDKVSALALLCPGGVGRHKNVLLWAAPLLMLGPWGRRKVREMIGRGAPADTQASPEAQAFGAFMELIFREFRPRSERLPRFGDADLGRLTMPLMTVLGGKDVFIDSPGTRDRLAAQVPHAEIAYLPEAGHFLMGETARIADFLERALAP